MKLSHPTADGIERPARLVPRPLRMLGLVLLAAATLGGFGAHAAFAAAPTVTLSFGQATIPPSGVVTMTATVSSAAGPPTGSVTFTDSSPGGGQIGSPVDLSANRASSISVSISPTLDAGRAHAIYVTYSPSFDDFLIGIDSATSATQTIGPPTGPTMHPTQVAVSAPTQTVESGTPITLTATVTNGIGNGVPTGSVTFSDVAHGSIPLAGGASFPVGADGTANLVIQDFSVGPHDIAASYSGDGANSSSSSVSSFHLDVTAPNVNLRTITSITLSPTTVAAGDTVTITATVVRVTGSGTNPASGGHVDFSAQEANGYSVPLGSSPLGSGSAPNEAVLATSNLVVPGDYTISASYFGDIFAPDTPGTAPVSVLPLRASTTIAYTGDDSAVFAHTAHVSATIADHDGVALPGRSVTFTLGADSCHATTDANGNAACSIAVNVDPGETAVTVDVAQDLQTHGVSSDFDFTVAAAPTTLTAGFQLGPVTTELTGTLLTEGAPLAGQSVRLSLGPESCTVPTDGAGVASCQVTTPIGPAFATLGADYAGSTDYLGSADSRLVQLVIATDLVYNGETAGAYHGAPVLSATLTDAANGMPVANRTVTFTLGTQTCSAVTDTSGLATCTIPSVTQDSGAYPVVASYGGDAVSLPSGASAPFAVAPASTTTVAAAPTPGATTTVLSATLNDEIGAPLSGKPLTLSLGSSSCSATTVAGVASCTVTTPSGPSATFTATFGGDLDYAPSSDSTPVVLLKPTVLSYTGPASGEYHDPLLFTGKLTDASGAGIGGQPVVFTIDSQTCSTTTTASGNAYCLILFVSQPAASTTLTMSFAGNATYAAQTSSSPFTVKHEDTTLLSLGSDGVINDSTITLRALLLEDHIFPVSGRTVTLTLGSSSCQGVTNGFGVVTCTVPRAAALGPTTFTGTFAQDAYYLGAGFSRTVVLCSFASGGSFVIGDRDDSGPVNFWGSQWSKKNHLSHGAAPSSFKGWAQGSFTPDGNGNWSTDPGSSSPPPSGQLPAYMAVIQTGSTSKSHSRISGDTVNIVVVKTDPGYAPNAGHDGTGTIVATVR